MRKLHIIAIGVVLTSVLAYFAYGYTLIIRSDPYHLFYYAVFPEHFRHDTSVVVPGVSSIAQMALSKRTDRQIKENLKRIGFVQPYTLASLPTRESRPEPDRLALAFKLTESLMARGIVSMDTVDHNGCSSLHNAIIQREWTVMEWLLEHDALIVSPGEPGASLAPCRLPARALLENRTPEIDVEVSDDVTSR